MALEATSEIIGPQTETRFKMTLQVEDDNPNVVSGITEALNKHSPVSLNSNLQDSTFFSCLQREGRIPAGGLGRQLSGQAAYHTGMRACVLAPDPHETRCGSKRL